jgi:DNA repair exonuclease SbcCD ATPase subunit
MKLKRLVLENCIGLVKGSDIDKLKIDFDVLDSSIIGIFGKVGSGKSTLLNNMNPYRANFGNDFYEDGYKEIEFEFKDNIYVSKIYQDKASLFKNGKLLNSDGKKSTYDEELEKEIGDEKVFMKLLYAGKRFKNILNLTKGERKELIVDYLLEYLKNYETYQVELKYQMEDLIDEIREEERNSDEYDEKIELQIETRKNIIDENKNYENIKEIIKELKAEQVKYEKQNEKNKDLMISLNQIGKDIDRLDKNVSENESDVEIKNIKIKNIREKYLKLKDEIPDVKLDEEGNEKNVNKLESLKIEYDECIDKMKKLSDDFSKMSSEIINLEKEIKNKEDKIEDLKLPCDSKLQVKCPFTEFRDIEKLTKEEKDKIKELKDKIKKLTKNKDDEEEKYKNEEIKKKEIRDKISEYEEQIKEYNDNKILLAKKPLLDEYKEQGKELKKEIEDLNLKNKKLKKEIETKNEDLKIGMEKYNSNSEYNDKTIELEEEQKKLNESNAQVTYLEKIFTDCKLKLEKLKDSKKLVEEKQNKLSEYDLLMEFFGKTGGQIFDIEQAGTEISNVANKLLEHYEDKSIIVKFDTLKENKKGEIKEVFDIAVSINNGDWQTYLSDGESVLVSNAIREAMCYLRSSKEFKTVFIDELDGSIDTDNIIGFIKLLEEGNKLNERQFTFLISHNEEVKSYLEKSIILKGDSIITKL